MLLTHHFTVGDFDCKVYHYNLGYGYKIFYKIKGKKPECIARSCVYFRYKDECYTRLRADLDTFIEPLIR